MRINPSRKDNYWILSVEGDLVDQPPGPLFDVQKATMEGAKEIILDFSSIGYLSANGVKNIRDSFTHAKQEGAHLGICAPPNQARAMLNLNGIPNNIPVYLNILEAVSRLDLIDYQPEWHHEQAELILVLQKELTLGRDLLNSFREHPLKPHFRIMPVRSLDEAVDILKTEKVGCVVIDSSFKVFRIAGFLDNVLPDNSINAVPFLVVSREDRLAEAEMMVRHGAHEMIQHPFRPIELVTRLHSLISHVKFHGVDYLVDEKVHRKA